MKRTLKRNYRGVKKLSGGPGGWHCPCCNPYDCAPRNMKRKARRLVRRTSKQLLRLVSE